MRTLVFILVLLLPASIAIAEDEEYVMVAIGDSITKAFNSGGFFFPRPRNSWAAGSSQTVQSHALRLEQFLGQDVEAHNFSVSGSIIDDIASQVSKAITVKPSYVTLLIGANDVCGWKEDYKEELFSFEDRLAAQVERLVDNLPDVKILLVSIPDIYQLWQLGSQNGCQGSWNFTGFCSAMLGENRTEADRLLVDEKWQGANESLRYISELFPENVKFTDSAMNYQFSMDEISGADCFHPSVKGQQSIASETWNDGWFVD